VKILYHIPNPDTIYAGRTIYHGYRNAFLDLGHEFRELTADDHFSGTLDTYQPQVFITGLSHFSLKYIDLDVLHRHRQRGMKVLVNVPFWRSPLSPTRVNESPSIATDRVFLDLLRHDRFGDVYFNSCEQDDERMAGFAEGTGRSYITVPLAADKTLIGKPPQDRFRADISYIGTYLPEKRNYFRQYVLPLGKTFSLRLYGQDWTFQDRLLGWINRFGQYFNLPGLRSLQKPKLTLDEEASVYASSVVCINVHEEYQKKYGGECNERTFKIPLYGGFEVTDDVSCIRRYFREDEEIVIARSSEEWLDKIRYYIEHPDKRDTIMRAGRNYWDQSRDIRGIWTNKKY